MSDGWNDERLEQAKSMWAQGVSATNIAREIGGALSRCAVLGKLRRLGLMRKNTMPAELVSEQRSKKSREAAFQRWRGNGRSIVRPRLPATPRVPIVHGNLALAQDAPTGMPEPQPCADVVPLGQRCTLMELSDARCRWPIGDPCAADFFFCGGKPVGELPYCAYHARIAYQPLADRRRDPRPARI